MKPFKPLKLQRSYALAFSSDGTFLITIARDVVVWDVESRKKRFRSHPLANPASCAIHPAATQLAVKSTNGKVAILDAHSGTTLRLFDQDSSQEGANIEYSADGAHLIDASWAGTLTVRCSTKGTIAHQVSFPGEMLTRISRTSSGDRWFVLHQPRATSSHGHPPASYISVWLWPLSSPIARLSINDAHIQYFVSSPDGTRLCILTRDSVKSIRADDGQQIASAPYASSDTHITAAWSPDGMDVATVQRDGVEFHAAETMYSLLEVPLKYASDVAFSPDGSLVALASWECGFLVQRHQLFQANRCGRE
jgi:WD40 repeat protein